MSTSNEVQYYESDFDFDEHAAAVREQINHAEEEPEERLIAKHDENDDSLTPLSQADSWNQFHSHHSAGNFYKPRRYLLSAFPCIAQYLAGGDDVSSIRVVLEVGCGSGSTCVPIIKECSKRCDMVNENIILLACDCSTTAVETTRRFIDGLVENESLRRPHFASFDADPSLTIDESPPFLSQVKSAHDDLMRDTELAGQLVANGDIGVAGIVLLVFVLSAVTPTRVNRFVQQIHETTAPGGKVCFRDYGLYDLPMLRFDSQACCRSSTSLGDPVYLRGEGTIARFFTLESTRAIFESAGFTTCELRYCTVYNINRKTRQKLKRVFVHGVFVKPHNDGTTSHCSPRSRGHFLAG